MDRTLNKYYYNNVNENGINVLRHQLLSNDLVK